MKNSFFLSDKNKYYIYGAGTVGRRIAKTLCDNGYGVECFFDKKVESVEENIPVNRPENLSKKFSENTVVAISLQNGIENESIALYFYNKYKINKLLFLPMFSNLSDERKRIIREVTSCLMVGICPKVKEIPLFNSDNTSYKIIDDTGDQFIRIWMHKDKIFVVGEKIDDVKRYERLYSYLDTCEGNLDDYLTIERSRDRRFASVESLIDDRRKLYNLFNGELKFGTKFFEDSPIPCRWDSYYRHIEITEGHHRLFFLIYRGFEYIPISMSYKDFDNMEHALYEQ